MHNPDILRRKSLATILDFVLYNILPDDPKETTAIKRKAPWFYYNMITWTLYHRSYDKILFRCLSRKEAHEALKEAHDCTCGAHQADLNLGTDSEDLATTSWRWCLTLSPMLDGVTLARFMVTSYIKHQAIFTQYLLFMAIWDVGNGRIGPINPPISKGH